MTIASDRWIRDQCLGASHFELYYDDVRQINRQGNVSNPYQFRLNEITRNGAVKEKIRALQPGESHEFVNTRNPLSDEKVKIVCVRDAPAKPLISPFIGESGKTIDVMLGEQTIQAKCPSYGLSSYGYDIRVGRKFTIFTYNNVTREDLHYGTDYVSSIKLPDGYVNGMFPHQYTEDIEGDYIDIPGGSFCLGVSMERICMPANVTAVCMAKSTLARMGLIAMVTPIEAGWEGYVTLEIHNITPNTIRLYAGIGIMQLIFHIGEEPCMVSYADRGGKYQDQPEKPVMGMS